MKYFWIFVAVVAVALPAGFALTQAINQPTTTIVTAPEKVAPADGCKSGCSSCASKSDEAQVAAKPSAPEKNCWDKTAWDTPIAMNGGCCAEKAQAAVAACGDNCADACAEKCGDCGGCDAEKAQAAAAGECGDCGGCDAEKAQAAAAGECGDCGGCDAEKAQAAAAGECGGKCDGGKCAEGGCQGACGGCGEAATAARVTGGDFLFVRVDGMCCNGCTTKIETAVKKLDGIANCWVHADKKLAVIETPNRAAVAQTVVAAVKEAGYEAAAVASACRFLQIDALHCGSCAETCSNSLFDAAGVLAVDVQLESKQVRIYFDTAVTTIDAIKTALAEATENHFVAAVVTETVTVNVNGMCCNGCVGKIRTALRAIDGVTDVTVCRDSRKAQITVAKGACRSSVLVDAIKAAGYEAAE